MSAIKDVVTLLLGIGNKTDYKKTKKKMVLPDNPDGNTIIKIFGDWLFETVYKNKIGFEEGVSIAFSILSSIFSTHFIRPFNQEYLNQFYAAIILTFQNLEQYSHSLGAILQHTEQLFLRNLDGLFLLIPHYLKLIKLILTSQTLPFSINISQSSLRRSSIIILKTMICFPNYFNKLSIPPIENYSQECIKDFNIISLFRSTILGSWSNETDPDNAILLLSAMGLFIFETLKKQTTVPPLFLLTIQKYICQPTEIQSQWPIRVLLSAISIIKSISFIVNEIHECSTQTIPNIVTGLSRIITKFLETPTQECSQQEFDLLIISILNTISELIVPHQWIFYYPNIIKEILNSIGQVLETKPKGKGKREKKEKKEKVVGISKNIITEAKFVFFKLMKITGNFPLPNETSTISTHITEEDIKKSFGLSQEEFLKYARFFLNDDNQIITIIDIPENIKNNNDPQTITIIRDLTGKYIWGYFFRMLPLSYKKNPEKYLAKHVWEGKPRPPNYEVTRPPTNKERSELEIKYGITFDTVNKFDKKISGDLKRIQLALTVQHRKEEVYRFLEEEISTLNISKKRPIRDESYFKNYNFNNSKIFLSGFGLLNFQKKQKNKLFNGNKNFYSAIQELDQLSERLQFSIGIIYIAKGQNRNNNGEGIFENKKGDPSYEKFLKQLGEFVDLQTHKGYKGGLKWEKTGRITPYYANNSIEIIYHVSTMLKNISTEEKKEIIGKNKLILVWCNDERHFNPKCIKSENNIIFFIIRPHYTGLSLVTIENYSGIKYYSGLLSKNSLLRKDVLVDLVRISSINHLCETQINEQKKYVHPFLKRNYKIQKIINQFSMSLSNEQFFTSFFSGKFSKMLNTHSDFEIVEKKYF
ncbi:hypothetical protein M0812_04484 [Anaeramoeba flamelloides]|uniref:Rap-GAP domain-containing protein n=1 Tax=Anaeramoeba flamelloides TaxID=1746091 RepID=A0AAV8AK65_9EUKA|nr:hypothetical protein M0812_04484 [Anaeramoeba flamelloides]